jgi:hypothetical protein
MRCGPSFLHVAAGELIQYQRSSRLCRTGKPIILDYVIYMSIFPQDLSNPEVARHLTLYPEISTGPISEVWQAMRWREFHRSELNPMWTSDGLQRFYIDELAELADGAFVVPLMWITFHGTVYAEVLHAERTEARVPDADLLYQGLICATGWLLSDLKRSGKHSYSSSFRSLPKLL